MKLRELAVLAILGGTTGAWAQTANVPANVNDCTLIQDPVELRNCILRFEGNRVPPPNVTESYGAKPIAPQTEATDPAASPDQTGRRARTRGKAAAEPNQAASAPRPNANGTLISIEQIRIPQKASR